MSILISMCKSNLWILVVFPSHRKTRLGIVSEERNVCRCVCGRVKEKRIERSLERISTRRINI